MSLLVQNLEVQVGSFRLEVPHLEVKAGEIYVLMGRSGSGKSTLLNAIAGFTPIVKGIIESGRVPIHDLPPEQRKVAFLFQKSALFPHLSVFGNVEFSLKIQKMPKPDRKEKVERWLERLQILDLKDRRPDELSGGQAQRVALARALVSGFPVLLLDEPFASLDTGLRQTLRERTRELIQEAGVSAVLVSHDPQDVFGLADRLGLIDQGRLRKELPAGDWASDPDALVRELLYEKLPLKTQT